MTERTPRQFCAVLRGPAGAGKSTLARAVQAALTAKVAVIDTDIFNWQIVPGEDDKDVVYENVVSLASAYLKHGYSVIVEGLILTDEERGAIARLREFAAGEQAAFADCYCSVPKDVALCRAERRERRVSSDKISAWWDLAEADKRNVDRPLVEIDMTVAVSENVAAVLDELTRFDKEGAS